MGVSLNWKRDEEEDDDKARAEEFMVELERLSRAGDTLGFQRVKSLKS